MGSVRIKASPAEMMSRKFNPPLAVCAVAHIDSCSSAI